MRIENRNNREKGKGKVKRKGRKHDKKACIDRLSFPFLLRKPLSKIPEAATSSYLGPFPRMHNLDGITQ